MSEITLKPAINIQICEAYKDYNNGEDPVSPKQEAEEILMLPSNISCFADSNGINAENMKEYEPEQWNIKKEEIQTKIEESYSYENFLIDPKDTSLYLGHSKAIKKIEGIFVDDCNINQEDVDLTTLMKPDPTVTSFQLDDTANIIKIEELHGIVDEWKIKPEEVDIKKEEISEQNEISLASNCISRKQRKNYTVKNSTANRSDKQVKQQNQNIHEPQKKPKKLYKCGECDYQSIRKGDINKHLRRHKSLDELEKFICVHCDYETIWKSDLKRHLHRHYPKSGAHHKCDKCNFQTTRKDTLRRHILIHSKPDGFDRMDSDQSSYEIIQKGTLESQLHDIFKCNTCDFQTTWKGSMKKHLIRHRIPDKIDLIKCVKCNYQTIWKGDLKKHLVLHRKPEEVQKFKCEHCDYETIWRSDLKRHLLGHNPESRGKHKCHQCRFQTARKDTLRKHLRRHSISDGTYGIEGDPSSYLTMQTGNLKSHLRNSRVEECDIFKCDQCDFKTSWKSSWKKHLIRHSIPSEIDLIKCNLCDYQTIWNGDLKKHRLVHKNCDEIETFNCDQCDFQTSRNDSFRRHISRHKRAVISISL